MSDKNAPQQQSAKPPAEMLEAVGKTFTRNGDSDGLSHTIDSFEGAVVFPRGIGLAWAFRVHRSDGAGQLVPATQFLKEHSPVKKKE